MKKLSCLFVLAAIPLAGCAGSSDVMDLGNGRYMISSHANHLAGGVSGANTEAYRSANKYCGTNHPGTHAIVLGHQENTTYTQSYNGNWNNTGGNFNGGGLEQGHVDMAFSCAN